MSQSKLTASEQITTLWNLGGLTIRELVKGIWQSVNDNYLLDRASALAFSFILALFPLLLFLLSLMGVFASHASALQTNLMQYLMQALPPAAFQVVSHTLTEVTRNT